MPSIYKEEVSEPVPAHLAVGVCYRRSLYLRILPSVFVTGNKICTVGYRITSMMVAQDARNKTQGLDRFGPSKGGNTLRPVCGCISLMLRRVLRDGFETWSSRGVEVMIWDVDVPKEAPLPPLYIRGAGLHEGVLVG